ncbi:hypothetical protein KPATCC21470_7633 [Kitasatospora purpeofusca]
MDCAPPETGPRGAASPGTARPSVVLGRVGGRLVRCGGAGRERGDHGPIVARPGAGAEGRCPGSTPSGIRTAASGHPE